MCITRLEYPEINGLFHQSVTNDSVYCAAVFILQCRLAQTFDELKKRQCNLIKRHMLNFPTNQNS